MVKIINLIIIAVTLRLHEPPSLPLFGAGLYLLYDNNMLAIIWDPSFIIIIILYIDLFEEIQYLPTVCNSVGIWGIVLRSVFVALSD